MSIGFKHQKQATPTRQWPDHETIHRAASQIASRSCCCPSRPAVIVLMPPAEGRPDYTDLLLCWHHYRMSRQALDTAGASVTGLDGRPVNGDWPDAVPGSAAPQATADAR